MTIKISLDAGALSFLMESDPDFALEIKSSVLAEIVKRHVRLSKAAGDYDRQIKKLVSDVAKKEMARYVGSKKDPKDTFGDKRLDALRGRIGKLVRDAVHEAYESHLKKAVKKLSRSRAEYEEKWNKILCDHIDDSARKHAKWVLGKQVEKAVSAALGEG